MPARYSLNGLTRADKAALRQATNARDQQKDGRAVTVVGIGSDPLLLLLQTAQFASKTAEGRRQVAEYVDKYVNGIRNVFTGHAPYLEYYKPADGRPQQVAEAYVASEPAAQQALIEELAPELERLAARERPRVSSEAVRQLALQAHRIQSPDTLKALAEAIARGLEAHPDPAMASAVHREPFQRLVKDIEQALAEGRTYAANVHQVSTVVGPQTLW